MQIKISLFFRPEGRKDEDFVDACQAWPEGTFLQGGHKGVVFVRGSNESYETTFVEAFVKDTTDSGFYRGEGETIAAAEEAAWRKYQRNLACGEHEWEARGYKNGGGFCKKCNTFGSEVIDPADLGQFCYSCGVPTTYGETTRSLIAAGGGNLWETDHEEERLWACKEHFPHKNKWWGNDDVLDEDLYDVLKDLGEETDDE
jgi:hypothetical protein